MRDDHLNYEKEISGCGIAGVIDEAGGRFDGETIIRAIAVMRERSNGLGGGFAGYGIYPEFPRHYCFHVMGETREAVDAVGEYLGRRCRIERKEEIPHRRDPVIHRHPLLARFFLRPRAEKTSPENGRTGPADDDERVRRMVMEINSGIRGACVFSSGKNMGIFKGVGYPEDIGRFFRLEEYRGYLWTAHGRFPTNTVGWWGGAHPFGILDWSVVHNGEISSYGINRRYLINFDYHCALFTDTEVITYLFDLLVRRHGLSFPVAAAVLAAPFWEEIERRPAEEREILTALRMTYGSALVNGPFSVIVARTGGMIGLNDRVKLRPLVAARKGTRLYLASEEAAIRAVCPRPDRVWMPEAGEAVVGKLRKNGDRSAGRGERAEAAEKMKV